MYFKCISQDTVFVMKDNNFGDPTNMLDMQCNGMLSTILFKTATAKTATTYHFPKCSHY